MTETSGPAHRPSGLAETWSVPVLWRPERPRVVVKADLLPAVSVFSLVSLFGLPLAWLWSRIAPAERVRIIATDGTQVPLELEDWHRFDDLAVFGFLMLGLGVVAGIVVWLMRERRGPVIFLAATAGVALAAVLGKLVGTSLATGHYAVTSAPALGAVIDLAPVVGSWWVVLAGPMALSLVYGLLAMWNGRDDLGRRLG